jgi:hypothetical protein
MSMVEIHACIMTNNQNAYLLSKGHKAIDHFSVSKCYHSATGSIYIDLPLTCTSIITQYVQVLPHVMPRAMPVQTSYMHNIDETIALGQDLYFHSESGMRTTMSTSPSTLAIKEYML